MVHDSKARKHYLNIRDEREEVKRPLGFQPPKNNVTIRDLYQQPYGVPWQHIVDAE